MAEIRYDSTADILELWYGDPEDVATTEETGDEILIKKDDTGTTIGHLILHMSERSDIDTGIDLGALPVPQDSLA
jgi:uncharacterized protein YuzE